MNLVVLALVVAVVAPVGGLRFRSGGNPAWRWLFALASVALAGLALSAALRVDAREVVALALMPTSILWLSLLAGLVDRVLQRDRWSALFLGSLALLLTVAGNGAVAGLLTRSLEAEVPTDDGASHFDAVLVLGGGTSLGRSGPELNGSGDRVLHAADLWRSGRTPLLVASGATLPTMDVPRALSDETAGIWREVGIPESAIVQLGAMSLVNTEAELSAFRDEAARRGWHHLGVVTNAWHMRRALRICEHLGLPVTPLAVGWRGGTGTPAFTLWLPRASALAEVERALWEYLGALKYR